MTPDPTETVWFDLEELPHALRPSSGEPIVLTQIQIVGLDGRIEAGLITPIALWDGGPVAWANRVRLLSDGTKVYDLSEHPPTKGRDPLNALTCVQARSVSLELSCVPRLHLTPFAFALRLLRLYRTLAMHVGVQGLGRDRDRLHAAWEEAGRPGMEDDRLHPVAQDLLRALLSRGTGLLGVAAELRVHTTLSAWRTFGCPVLRQASAPAPLPAPSGMILFLLIWPRGASSFGYSEALVVATDEEEARSLHPDGARRWTGRMWRIPDPLETPYSGRAYADLDPGGWAPNPADLCVEAVGVASAARAQKGPHVVFASLRDG